MANFHCEGMLGAVTPDRRHILKRWTIRLLVSLVVLPVLLWLLAMAGLQSAPAKEKLRSVLQARLGTDVNWQWLWWNPMRGIVFEKFAASPSNPQSPGYSLDIRRLTVRLNYRMLLHKRVVISALDIDEPMLRLRLRGNAGMVAPPALEPFPPVDLAATQESLATGMPVAAVDPASASPQPAQLPSAAITEPATSTPPPPDVSLAIRGGRVEVVESGNGQVLASVGGVEFSLDPKGGSLAATLGLRLADSWRDCRVDLPARWFGQAIEVVFADRGDTNKQLKAVARLGMVPGFPALVILSARDCPVDWCTVPAHLAAGYFPVKGEFSADFQAVVMLARPEMRAAMIQAESRNWFFSTTGLPAAPALEELIANMEPGQQSDTLSINQIQIQATLQGNQIEVPRMQVDAGGALAAVRFRVDSNGTLTGDSTILLGREGEARLRRLEERLPADRRLGFDGQSQVRFPDGSTGQWRSRVVPLGGTLRQPLLGIWPALGLLSPGNSLIALRQALRPADPEKVDLIPLGN